MLTIKRKYSNKIRKLASKNIVYDKIILVLRIVSRLIKSFIKWYAI